MKQFALDNLWLEEQIDGWKMLAKTNKKYYRFSAIIVGSVDENELEYPETGELLDDDDNQ
jgi:hypothetical protein